MKKVLSVLMSMITVCCSLALSFPANAQENNPIIVEYSVCDGGEFTLSPTKIQVSADLSNKYADQIGYNDKSSDPTILDATIAAHIEMFGEDFMDYAPFLASSAAGITSAFGEETGALTYRLNGTIDNGSGIYYNLDTEVASGDYIEFMFYQDTVSWSDAYTYFNVRDIDVMCGDGVTLTLYAEAYDNYWNIVKAPAAGLSVTVNGNIYGVTDENGQITINTDAIGAYSVSAFGDLDGVAVFAPYCRVNVSTYLYTYVNNQLENGTGYVFADTEFSTNNAVDFVNHIRSGKVIDDNTQKAFVDSVYDNLSKNQGKLLTESGEEDLGLYGACIVALQELGYDAKSFCGYDNMGEEYDVISSFEAVEPNKISNPYYYRLAIEAAEGEFAKALCDQLISDYYTLGKGMNYWGYGCDNTAVFLTAIAGYASDYSEYVNDAMKIIAGYTTDKGAHYSEQYTDENANSTAMALMAFSALGDCDTALKYYNMLLNFQGETGIFTYYGNADLYATKDCVTALGYFSDLVYSNSLEHNEHIYTSTEVAPTCGTAGKKTSTCLICGKTVTDKIPATKNHKYVGKVTKVPTTKAVGVMTYTCSGCGYKFTREIPKLATTSITAVSSRSKSFGIRWKKQTSSTGYQIRYSTGSKMTNAKNVLVTEKTAVTKMITGLKANKKYYVQIRTYRVINGKRYYSDWSAVKSVTTKK